jgi:hypothetical protein
MKIHDLKRYRSFIAVVILLLAALLLQGLHGRITSQLDTQRFAARWSGEEKYAQVSCFFPEGNGIAEAEVISMEQTMMSALTDAGIDTADGGRKLVDAYSTQTSLTISSDRGSTTARVYGVSKDFFLFHPLELLSGTYFTQSDEAEDGIILDETVAWKLFGSGNVAGLTVDIGSRTYVVRGVVKSDKGLFSEASDEEADTVYVDYSVLKEQTDGDVQIDCYEVLMVNPVSKFAVNTLEDVLGRSEDSMELVENSARFGFVSRLTRLKSFGTRSMNTKAIVYPYWENRARGYEDLSTLILVIQILLLVYPVLFLCRLIYLAWKNKYKLREWIKKLYKDLYRSGKIQNFFVQCTKVLKRIKKTPM